MYKSKKKCLEDVAFRINMVLKPLFCIFSICLIVNLKKLFLLFVAVRNIKTKSLFFNK